MEYKTSTMTWPCVMCDRRQCTFDRKLANNEKTPYDGFVYTTYLNQKGLLCFGVVCEHCLRGDPMEFDDIRWISSNTVTIPIKEKA